MTGKKTHSKINTDPVYLQIYKQILSGIREHRWLPGEKLPSDMEFAKEFGINHLTLKKAMNRLAAAMIFTAQGIPFFLSGEEYARTKPIEGTDEVSENMKKYFIFCKF